MVFHSPPACSKAGSTFFNYKLISINTLQGQLNNHWVWFEVGEAWDHIYDWITKISDLYSLVLRFSRFAVSVLPLCTWTLAQLSVNTTGHSKAPAWCKQKHKGPGFKPIQTDLPASYRILLEVSHVDLIPTSRILNTVFCKFKFVLFM